jgi:two-component system, NarL family, sensor histidine kinase UhpB
MDLNTQGELIEGLLQFVTLVESERKLLAADLHDQTLSDLRELARLARRLFEKPEDAMSQEVRNGLAKLIFGIDAAMDEVRRAMESLSPSALDTLGLVPAIESCLTRSSQSGERPFLTRFACPARMDDINLSETEQLLIYRIVQEALNNISKHASARFVEIVIMRESEGLLIRVSDDGRGMTASGDLRRARGIDNMRYRARLIGAELTWLRATGRRGTVVEVRLPIRGSGAGG